MLGSCSRCVFIIFVLPHVCGSVALCVYIKCTWYQMYLVPYKRGVAGTGDVTELRALDYWARVTGTVYGHTTHYLILQEYAGNLKDT